MKNGLLNPNRPSKLYADSVKARNRNVSLIEKEKNTGGLLEGIGYVGGKMGLGALGLFEGVGDILAATGDLVTGNTDMAQHRFLDNKTAQLSQGLDEWYNPDGFMQFMGDVGGGIGNSAVLLIPYAGTPLFAAGVVGQGVSSAGAKTGKVGWNEVLYGAASGGVEFGLEALTGGVGGAAVKNVGKVIGKTAAKEGAEGLGKKVLKDTLKGAAGEFVEEAASTAIDPHLLRATGVDPNAQNATFGEIMRSGAVGAVSGALMTAPTSVAAYKTNEHRGKKIALDGKAGKVVSSARAVSSYLSGVQAEAEATAKGFADENPIFQARARHTLKRDSKRSAQFAEALRENLAAWDSMTLEDKSSSKGHAVLGEMQINTLYAQINGAVESEVAQIVSSEEKLSEIAEYLRGKTDKEYSLEDLRADKDGALSQAVGLMLAERESTNLSKVRRENTARAGAFKEGKRVAKDIRRTMKGTQAGENTAQGTKSDADGNLTAEQRNEQEWENKASDLATLRRALGGTKLSEGMKDTIISTYYPVAGMSAEDYATAFAMATIYGRSGADKAYAYKDNYVSRLPREVADAAYSLGQKQKSGAEAENKKASADAEGGKKYSVDDVVDISDNEELSERISNSSKSKYDVIKEYLIEKFGGHRFVLSDGRSAIMDKRDAKELSHKANEARTAQLGNLQALIENAKYDHSALGVSHPKFSDFHYYTVSARYKGEVFDLWLNVGTAKNDGENHIYAITKNEEAPTNYGVSRPVGNAIQNASSDNSISQPTPKVNTSDEKSFRRSSREGRVIRAEGVNMQKLSDRQYAAYKAAEIMARALGADIVIHADLGQTKNGKPINGYFDEKNNTIHVNINAMRDGEHIALYTLSHEVTHYIKAWSGEKYKTLEKFVFERLAEGNISPRDSSLTLENDTRGTVEDLIKSKADALRAAGLLPKGATEVQARELAREEVVCDGMEAVLADGEVLRELAARDKTLWEKIKDVVLRIIDRVKAAYATLSGTSKTAQVLSDTMDSLDGIKQLFTEAVTEAGDARRSGKDADVTGINAEKMQVGEDSYNEYTDYDKPITVKDIEILRSIGRKSINEFTSEEIKKAQKWAYKFYRELGVKSPFFRAWFGDWRSEQKNDFVEIANIPEYVGTNEARKQNRGTVENDDTEWHIRISREGETNTISHAGDERLSEYGLSGIRNLVKNAVFLDSEVHEHHNNNAQNDLISFDHKLYALGKDTSGHISLYKITVEEYFQSKSEPGNKRFHNLKYITKIADNVGGRTFENTRSGGSTNDTSANYSISDLYEFVKRYDKEFSPAPEVNPVLLNEDGTPKVLYHQASEDFTEFDPYHEGAGTNDDETPFGIFMKPTDADIGLQGKKQMPLYARIVNPLHVKNRAELSAKLKGLSSEYAKIKREIDNLNISYARKIDEAEAAATAYAKEYRDKHPNATSSEIYDDVEYQRLDAIADEMAEEFLDKEAELTEKAKQEITRVLQEKRYDGVIIERDEGTLGRVTETYIALDNKQIKSAADNIGTFNGESTDIRYSFDDSDGEIPDVGENEGADADERSAREILSGAMLELVESQEEYNLVKKYREGVALLETVEEKRDELKRERYQTARQISELRAAQKEDGAPSWIGEEIKALEKRHEALSRQISEQEKILDSEDGKLLQMEAMKPIADVLKRKRLEASRLSSRLQRMQESQDKKLRRERERADTKIQNWREAREATKDRHTLRRTMSRLYRRLLSPTKERNVPESMRAAVADAMKALNMDVSGIDQLADIEAELEKMYREDVPDADKIAKLERKRDYLEERSASLKKQTEALLEAYEKAVKEDGSTFAPEVLDKLKDLRERIGDTGIYAMNHEQLRAAKDFYTMILTQVNDAGKLFAEERKSTVEEYGEAITDEIRDAKVPKIFKPKPNENPKLAAFRKYMWNALKPVYAFDLIGSPTLSRLFENLRRGESVAARDIEEAKEYFARASEKYGFTDWNMKELHEITASNGKKVELTLGELMSLFAYSRRTQAGDHLRVGGFMFESDALKELKKTVAGIEIKKELRRNDQAQYTIDEDAMAEVGKLLTDKQKTFIDEMVHYLSDTMGQKGNSVSRKLYGIDLFREAWYFPLKSKKDFLNSQTTEKGDPKVKNRGMAKETVPGAENPIVLRDFMRVWSDHVNDMAAYHGLVLPMEDLNRVLDYRRGMGISDGADAKIRAGMTDAQRAVILKGQKITLKEIHIDEKFDLDWNALEKNRKSLVEKPLVQKMRDLGYLKQYQTDAIDVNFEFTGGGLRKSMNSQTSDYGGSLGDLAKVVMNMQAVLDSAVLMEVHTDKATGTERENKQLVQTYVMLSAFKERNTVTPVQLEVKQYVDGDNRLYLAVAMTKIETGVMDDTIQSKNPASTRLLPVSDISIPQLIEKINPRDENFFKYIPDEFLSAEQKAAKQRAFDREDKKYGRTTRTYEASSANTEQTDNFVSLKSILSQQYGEAAVQYIEQLLRDLNGGIRQDGATDMMDKGISLFKKAAVMGSLSVVIQQPSAIVRAFAIVDPKYFKGLRVKDSGAAYEEIKKYAPVAIIKEMGGFDTGVGQATGDYITEREYDTLAEKGKAFINDKDYRDRAFGYLAQKADELTWIQIWEACKREQAELHPDMKADSDELLRLAGQRFSEVITRTQVYDSTLSRSAYMRSKSSAAKMLTAFMAEPTTAINMLVNGFVQFERNGDGKALRGTVGAVAGAVIFNAILSSIIYAMRDDDEDQTYAEKYVESLSGEVLDSLNPVTMLPFAKDIYSIAQGYDVERTDMAVIADLWQSIEAIPKGTKPWYEKTLDLAANTGSLFGLPTRNILRDTRGIIGTVSATASGDTTTAAGIGYSAAEGALPAIPVAGPILSLFVDNTVSNGQQLYNAIISGDKAHYNRVLKRFKSETQKNTALRTALRDSDERIRDAAQARVDGDISTYSKLVREVMAEGFFDEVTVKAAVNAEYNDIMKDIESGAEDNKDEESTQVVSSVYSSSMLNSELDRGDFKEAKVIMDDLIAARVAAGKTEKEARSAVRSSVTSYWKKRYIAAKEAKDSAEMRRIRSLLTRSGLYGGSDDVIKLTEKWLETK